MSYKKDLMCKLL
jgi:hypothetical protein